MSQQELKKEIQDRINYFYKQIDGTYDFPNSKEGDLLKMVNRMLKESEYDKKSQANHHYSD